MDPFHTSIFLHLFFFLINFYNAPFWYFLKPIISLLVIFISLAIFWYFYFLLISFPKRGLGYLQININQTFPFIFFYLIGILIIIWRMPFSPNWTINPCWSCVLIRFPFHACIYFQSWTWRTDMSNCYVHNFHRMIHAMVDIV